MAITLMLGGLDKVVLSNAVVYGLTKDTHLRGQQYSWVSSIFDFGSLFWIAPSVFLMQRFPVGKYVAVNVFLWGLALTCHAACQNYAGLLVCRFFLGAFEVAKVPAFSAITAMWYRKHEQPLRATIWYNAFSSVFNGLVSYGCGHIHGALDPWRYIFIVTGSFTMGWAFVCWFLLPDSPEKASFLNGRERMIAVDRAKSNQTGTTEDKAFKKEQVWEALKDPNVYIMWIFVVMCNIPNGGILAVSSSALHVAQLDPLTLLSQFNGLIIKGLGFSSLNTTLLGIPTGVISTVTGWIFSLLILYTRGKVPRTFWTGCACILPIIGTVLINQIPKSNADGRLGGLYFFYTYLAVFTTSLSLPIANTGGYTKKLFIFSGNWVAYCVGNFIGPQAFLAKEAPRYETGIHTMLGCYCACIALIAIYGVNNWFNNKKRDKDQAAESYVPQMVEPWMDITDFNNKAFRYTY